MNRRGAGRLLYHGGAKRLWRGDIVTPDHTRCVEGCPTCEARRRGSDAGLEPATPGGWVYGTTNRRYARFYASMAVGGDLYKIELIGEFEPSTEDHFPSWRARTARVIRVIERRIILTMRERRDLFKRWGGTDQEFDQMLTVY